MIRPFRLSVAAPVHNEEAVVPELLRRLYPVLDSLDGGPHEIVLVDDGSTDQTLATLELASQQDPRLVIVALSRNFVHQAALAAALDRASGDAIVIMDGDLQDKPEAIHQFTEKYREGYDVVYAKRIRRKKPWWLRSLYYNRSLYLLSRFEYLTLGYLPVPFGSSVVMLAKKIPSLSTGWDETLDPQQLKLGTGTSGLSRASMKCERGSFVKNKFQIKPCGQCRAIGHAVREAHFAGHWFRG
jgi:glycosyltransferase involved in cell wall biosynthesis